MSKLESIKGKILELEAGIFQNLCNAYLSRIGYPNIVALGSQAGTNKTTPGTPDTYFPDNNDKYIFVEYTVQQDSIFNKLSDDIDKCLDEEKTNISISSISEIICCFTSSNLKPGDYDTLMKKCNDKGISLNLIGIDKLADELYRNHKALVKEYLGISIDTEQILDIKSFICSYNRGLMFAPLDTKFLFRDKELQELSDDFAKYDVVLLQGAAGTGKTRLALHFAEKHAQDNKEKLLCIKNNGQPIYEDLKIEMESPGQYFLVIDDANQLSSLQSIVDYVNRKDQGYSVKVLITVRDYALNKVVKDLLAIVDFCKVAIEPFSDDEIKKIVKENLGIIIVVLYFKWNPDTVSMLRMIYEFGKVFIIFAFSFLWLFGLGYYQLCVKYKDLTSRSLLYDTREYELSPLKLIHYAKQSDDYLLDLKQFNRQDWKNSDGILFGYSDDGRLVKLSSSAEANIFIAGAPGSRKTTGIVLPSCSAYKGSILAVDIKGDIYNFSKTNRKIKRFCPDLTDERGKNIALEKSCCFDPFFGIEELSPTDRKLFVENMSLILIPDDNEKDNYFSTNARKLFRGILLFLLAICPNLTFPEYIAAVLHHQKPKEYNFERFPANVFQWVQMISDSSNLDAVECVAGMLGNNEKNIAGVFDRLCTGLTPYSNDILSVLLSKSDNSITPKLLEQGYDVYLQISQSNIDVYAPLFTLIIQQFMMAFSRRPDTSSGYKNRPILMILDEFPQLTFPYKYINSALSTLRSKSIQCMLVAQSVAQINKKYGNDGCQSLLGNCSYQLCLKANDIVTQEHFSKLIGTKRTLKINYSSDNNAVESREPVYYPESFGALDDKLVIYYNGRHEMINKIKPFI